MKTEDEIIEESLNVLYEDIHKSILKFSDTCAENEIHYIDMGTCGLLDIISFVLGEQCALSLAGFPSLVKRIINKWLLLWAISKQTSGVINKNILECMDILDSEKEREEIIQKMEG